MARALRLVGEDEGQCEAGSSFRWGLGADGVDGSGNHLDELICVTESRHGELEVHSDRGLVLEAGGDQVS